MTREAAGRATPAELLRKAADFYLRVEAFADAARCFAEIPEYLLAAQALKRSRNIQAAAEMFERAQAMQQAASCYRDLGRHADCARCFLESGDAGEAAWTYVHFANAPRQAAACLAQWENRTPDDDLAAEVVGIRIGCADGAAQPGARLQAAIKRLQSVETEARRNSIVSWALEIAALLGRPDLEFSAYAAALRAGSATASENWRQWCLDRFQEDIYLPPREGLLS
jgi:hypothetical protein